ncbi:DivIVA domain-containing protein [Actinoalloteichus caeruleus]|uniref:DivIVA domain-containing protein n=1 Tax=Actinoalloteichus cyanogriseus TaxID=2893586 RepID=UPI003AB058EA
MTTLFVYFLIVAMVAAVVFLLASLVFGRGEELAPLPPGVTPTTLPERAPTGSDVRALRFQQAVRGYRMTEVDWALAEVADELDRLRARVAGLEARLARCEDLRREPEPVEGQRADRGGQQREPGTEEGGDAR